MVEFNFKKSTLGLTEEEFQKKKEEKPQGKFFEPGTYTLRIKDADFAYDKDGNCMSKADPTWAKVLILFADAGGREMKHWLLIPTSKLYYNEKNSKRPEFVYMKFREFMAGIGVETDASFESVKSVVPKYFKDPKNLIGKEVEAEIGYQGPYIHYAGKEQFKICKRNGEEITDEVFGSKEEAMAKAIEIGLKIEGFTRILTFYGKEIVDEVEEKEKW